ncbi:MAG: sugar ABC transporter ATP-binding protein [Chloroflexi bacterium]|nr:MAG: sugar ABC transporter ATP-binding protein [Chloroflexota bacterium]
MDGVSKDFPGVHALRDCHFDLRRGEVHALVGENGAGKSTLMKILAGVYRKDSGRVRVKGADVDVTTPRAAQLLGISIIHQELSLIPNLTAAQNIFIGREPRGALPFLLDDRALNRNAKALFDQLHLKIDPETKVANLAIIRKLRETGVGVVHISHRLEELKRISDRVTVMRDGQYIATVETKDATIEQIIRMMVGRTIFEEAPVVHETDANVVLDVRDLSRGRTVQHVSFNLHRGEILGFAGLVGAGRTEVARAVFGADRADSAEIRVHGKPAHIRSPGDAVGHGIGYLSEDRKRYGLALSMDVETNIVLATFRKFVHAFGRIDAGRTRSTALERVKRLAIKTPSIRQKVRNLSGGNQQKVVIAKWLTADTEILIFDEPTRGIDVGAKSEIYHLLNELAHQGKAIIMISSELPEILRMSHRILVMCEGRITGELAGAGATQEQIMTYATMREAVAQAN